mmetsp:Transcript_6708/g.15320  ORF Transcript_6708/g.15320 Transcript_6708/m.15320 type:complete len:85 (-) Transcript_6708:167-421(-)
MGKNPNIINIHVEKWKGRNMPTTFLRKGAGGSLVDTTNCNSLLIVCNQSVLADRRIVKVKLPMQKSKYPNCVAKTQRSQALRVL